MIIGEVDANGNAIVSLQLYLGGTGSVHIDAVVDTGFTDWIALPRDVIQSLNLPMRDETDFVLADGSMIRMRTYSVVVAWFDRLRHVILVEVDGAPLTGMQLLRGSRLTIDVTPNGRVMIEPLPASC